MDRRHTQAVEIRNSGRLPKMPKMSTKSVITAMTKAPATTQLSPRQSLNGIINSYSNIENLYHFGLCKIRLIEEEAKTKTEMHTKLTPAQITARVHSEMDKLLPENLLVPPTLEELIKIAHEMGVVLSLKMAN